MRFTTDETLPTLLCSWPFLLTSLFYMSIVISVWVTKTRSCPQRFPLRQNCMPFWAAEHWRCETKVKVRVYGCRSVSSDTLNSQQLKSGRIQSPQVEKKERRYSNKGKSWEEVSLGWEEVCGWTGQKGATCLAPVTSGPRKPQVYCVSTGLGYINGPSTI